MHGRKGDAAVPWDGGLEKDEDAIRGAVSLQGLGEDGSRGGWEMVDASVHWQVSFCRGKSRGLSYLLVYAYRECLVCFSFVYPEEPR